MHDLLNSSFFGSFGDYLSAIYEKYGIDEAVRYLLYISQQIVNIRRINIICTNPDVDSVIPVADSSKDIISKIVSSSPRRYALVGQEQDIFLPLVINNLDEIKSKIYPQDKSIVQLPFYSYRSLLRIPLFKKGDFVYLINFWSSEKDTFTEQHKNALQELLGPLVDCMQHSYADAPFYAPERSGSLSGYERLSQCRGLSNILDALRRVAPTRATILIQGESGTGKEIVAEAVHELSARKDQRFIRVNCGALTESLLESELFGHVRGAFTGAVSNRMGFFEFASGGTLFLDEIGELSLPAQARLLRAIDSRTIQRIGSPETMSVDVRLIAATNRDLRQMVREGSFREDLYFRLSVYRLTLPPLREHSVDLDTLVRYFIRKKAEEYRQDAVPFPSRDEMRKLYAYSWPGNVRELQNVVERALIDRCGSQPGAPLQFDLTTEMLQSDTATAWPTLEGVEKEYIERVLKKCGHRLTGPQGAAALLGIHYTTLRAKMVKYGIE